MHVAKKIRKTAEQCWVCNEIKAGSEFIAIHRGRYRVCKSCKNHINRLGRYHITPDDYTSLLEKQLYRCAICESELELERNKAVIDHCHDTHEVRGVLCRECNNGLGHFRDSDKSLANALEYLKKPPARGVVAVTKVREKYQYMRNYLKAKQCNTQ